tara:strand:- start:30862 stop:32493 length:1632 start_codon:yes stop_codon:yes gene_type:complete
MSTDTTSHDLFQYAPAALWEVDFSYAKTFLDQLPCQNEESFAYYLLEHPDDVETIMSLRRVVRVNEAALGLFKAKSREQLISHLPNIHTHDGMRIYLQALVDMRLKRKQGELFLPVKDFETNIIPVRFAWRVMKGYEDTYQRMVFSYTPGDRADVKLQATPLEVMVREVKNERLIRAKLESEHQRLIDIVESTSDLVVTVDNHRMLCYLNKAGRQLLGISDVEDITRYTIADIHPQYFIEKTFVHVLTVLQTEDHLVTDVIFLSQSGEEILTSLATVAHKSPTGELLFMSAVARDVRNMRETERHMQQMKDEIADIYRLNSMGEVASGIAHEINQPLTAVVNYASGCLRRLRTDSVAPEIFDAMEKVVFHANRAGEIVHRIKDYLRRGELQREAASVNELIESVLSLPQFQFLPQNMMIETQLNHDLPNVEVDTIYIKQVLVNLLENAIDAMKHDVQQLHHLQIKTLKTPKGDVVVSVKDTGLGIPVDMHSKIFHPLYTTKEHGTGLGLAISRYIVEQHEGQITVESKIGEGSQFDVVLPSSG